MQREVAFILWPLTKTLAFLFYNSSPPKFESFTFVLRLSLLFFQAARTVSRMLFYSVLPLHFTPSAARPDYSVPLLQGVRPYLSQTQRWQEPITCFSRGVIPNAERVWRECVLLESVTSPSFSKGTDH